MPKPTLLYIADPMCSWCWGFAPQLRRIREALPHLPVRIVLGGLAPDTEEPMPSDMRRYVQQAWDAVETTAGVSFNREFWDGRHADIRRSTYPACRAVVLARTEGKEMAMFDAIQRAYYLEARNPSRADVLADCGEAIGLSLGRQTFLESLHASTTQSMLEADLQLRGALGANTFPSLGLMGTGLPEPGLVLHRGWGTAKELVPRLEASL